ncbi:pyrimidine 5'-nucleotidase [Klebsiella pneumoniae]|uniref:pyrimidine 5'-nucleotidase n=1 Tax=Klebsiella pneumoniae TaxID=573 RepID=UPI003F821B98
MNKPLWVDYQNGAITSLQLQHQRFDSWAERLNVPPGELNDAFMNAMAEICAPLPGAVSLLNALQGKVRMGIITNGFTSLQQTRLERTGLRDHFDLLIISEQVGVAKPDARIFDYALAQAGNPPRSRVLMVGDLYRRRFSGLSGREQAAMGGLPKRRHHLATITASAF